MKRLISTAWLAAISASPAFALNPVPGWYAGLSAAISYPPNIEMTVFDPVTLTLTPGDISYKILGGGGLQLGYRLHDNYRVEFEFLATTNSYKNITINGVTYNRGSDNVDSINHTVSGHTNQYYGFINGFYDSFTPGADASFVPYIGLGLGYAKISNSIYFIDPNKVGVPGTQGNLSSSSPAGQFILGASYFLDDFTAVSLDFRYSSTPKIRTSTSTMQVNDQRFQLYTLNIIMNFAFDSSVVS